MEQCSSPSSSTSRTAECSSSDDDNTKLVTRNDESSLPLHKEEQQSLQLTASSLLDVCRLPAATLLDGSQKEQIRQRIQILRHWKKTQHTLLQTLLFDDKQSGGAVDPKSGCFPLHWAAGTGFTHGVKWILELLQDQQQQQREDYQNQQACFPSTGRTPLHYAARNGHLETCRLLMETFHANPNPKCARGKVTPLQLAVWQNQLEIVQYLVSSINDHAILLERNEFNCGLMHWIGLIPQKRWNVGGDGSNNNNNSTSDNNRENTSSANGSGVLPLAKYLHNTLGISYQSTPDNCQNQGHTPFHKACWGGNIALLKYYRDVHGVYDTVQDNCGNYGADLAKMAGHDHVHQWLLQNCSLERFKSCQTLGISTTATLNEIKQAYLELAKKHHPDKRHQQQQHEDDQEAAFLKIKAAYEHLIHRGGIGTQCNPKYEAVKLLTNNAMTTTRRGSGNDGEDENVNNVVDDDLFQARILTILDDFGEKGFPISAIAKRWNQIWPDRPFPTPEQYMIPVKSHGRDNSNNTNATTVQNGKKRVKLLRFLKWKCKGVVQFRQDESNRVVLAFPVTTTRVFQKEQQQQEKTTS